jgi:hypothetical protein
MNQALDRFIHCAVAAQDQHQIGSLANGFLGEGTSFAGRGSGQETRRDTAASQRGNGTLENTLGIAPQRASGGIIDKNRLAKQFE